jgi:hypothetical protein
VLAQRSGRVPQRFVRRHAVEHDVPELWNPLEQRLAVIVAQARQHRRAPVPPAGDAVLDQVVLLPVRQLELRQPRARQAIVGGDNAEVLAPGQHIRRERLIVQHEPRIVGEHRAEMSEGSRLPATRPADQQDRAARVALKQPADDHLQRLHRAPVRQRAHPRYDRRALRRQIAQSRFKRANPRHVAAIVTSLTAYPPQFRQPARLSNRSASVVQSPLALLVRGRN